MLHTGACNWGTSFPDSAGMCEGCCLEHVPRKIRQFADDISRLYLSRRMRPRQPVVYAGEEAAAAADAAEAALVIVPRPCCVTQAAAVKMARAYADAHQTARRPPPSHLLGSQPVPRGFEAAKRPREQRRRDRSPRDFDRSGASQSCRRRLRRGGRTPGLAGGGATGLTLGRPPRRSHRPANLGTRDATHAQSPAGLLRARNRERLGRPHRRQ